MPLFQAGPLALGKTPRVVGTITQRETIAQLPAQPDFRSDLVELRLDMAGTDTPGWLDACQSLERADYPVILTLRMEAEGGQWTENEALRAPVLQKALPELALVDIEQRSVLYPDLCRQAADLDKSIIVSYHDFEQTPSLTLLRDVVQSIFAFPAAIPKIVTMVSRNKDIETLRQLLSWNSGRPICVLGMGLRGRGTRISFPALGSCLTYGFIDGASAPGQPTAADLVAQLRDSMPAYNTDRATRRRD